MVSSGLRIGTSALATRVLGHPEFAEAADIIATTLVTESRDEVTSELWGHVGALAALFPLYPNLKGGQA